MSWLRFSVFNVAQGGFFTCFYLVVFVASSRSVEHRWDALFYGLVASWYIVSLYKDLRSLMSEKENPFLEHIAKLTSDRERLMELCDKQHGVLLALLETSKGDKDG